jgi:hypothetical protein
MSENTRICKSCCSTPQIAVNSSQLITNTQNLSQWIYVSTVTAQNKVTNPNYIFTYKDQSDRLQAKMGRLSLNQCT